MMTYVMRIVLGALVVGTGGPAVVVTATEGAEVTVVRPGNPNLDKTWTRRGQESEAGSQVLVSFALTSPGSFQAEGKGFEPSTGLPGI